MTDPLWQSCENNIHLRKDLLLMQVPENDSDYYKPISTKMRTCKVHRQSTNNSKIKLICKKFKNFIKVKLHIRHCTCNDFVPEIDTRYDHTCSTICVSGMPLFKQQKKNLAKCLLPYIETYDNSENSSSERKRDLGKFSKESDVVNSGYLFDRLKDTSEESKFSDFEEISILDPENNLQIDEILANEKDEDCLANFDNSVPQGTSYGETSGYLSLPENNAFETIFCPESENKCEGSFKKEKSYENDNSNRFYRDNLTFADSYMTSGSLSDLSSLLMASPDNSLNFYGHLPCESFPFVDVHSSNELVCMANFKNLEHDHICVSGHSFGHVEDRANNLCKEEKCSIDKALSTIYFEREKNHNYDLSHKKDSESFPEKNEVASKGIYIQCNEGMEIVTPKDAVLQKTRKMELVCTPVQISFSQIFFSIFHCKVNCVKPWMESFTSLLRKRRIVSVDDVSLYGNTGVQNRSGHCIEADSKSVFTASQVKIQDFSFQIKGSEHILRQPNNVKLYASVCNRAQCKVFFTNTSALERSYIQLKYCTKFHWVSTELLSCAADTTKLSSSCGINKHNLAQPSITEMQDETEQVFFDKSGIREMIVSTFFSQITEGKAKLLDHRAGKISALQWLVIYCLSHWSENLIDYSCNSNMDSDCVTLWDFGAGTVLDTNRYNTMLSRIYQMLPVEIALHLKDTKDKAKTNTICSVLVGRLENDSYPITFGDVHRASEINTGLCHQLHRYALQISPEIEVIIQRMLLCCMNKIATGGLLLLDIGSHNNAATCHTSFAVDFTNKTGHVINTNSFLELSQLIHMTDIRQRAPSYRSSAADVILHQFVNVTICQKSEIKISKENFKIPLRPELVLGRLESNGIIRKEMMKNSKYDGTLSDFHSLDFNQILIKEIFPTRIKETELLSVWNANKRIALNAVETRLQVLNENTHSNSFLSQVENFYYNSTRTAVVLSENGYIDIQQNRIEYEALQLAFIDGVEYRYSLSESLHNMTLTRELCSVPRRGSMQKDTFMFFKYPGSTFKSQEQKELLLKKLLWSFFKETHNIKTMTIYSRHPPNFDYLCKNFFKKLEEDPALKTFNKTMIDLISKIFFIKYNYEGGYFQFPVFGRNGPADTGGSQGVSGNTPRNQASLENSAAGAALENTTAERINVANTETVREDLEGLAIYFHEMQHGPQPTLRESMRFEWMRLKSFWSFPSNIGVSPISLAKWGFYYTGNCGETRCFCCVVSYREWEPGDDPEIVHRRISPSCPFLLGTDLRNVPVSRYGLPRLPLSDRPESTISSADPTSRTLEEIAAGGLDQALSQPSTSRQRAPAGLDRSNFMFIPPSPTVTSTVNHTTDTRQKVIGTSESQQNIAVTSINRQQTSDTGTTTSSNRTSTNTSTRTSTSSTTTATTTTTLTGAASNSGNIGQSGNTVATLTSNITSSGSQTSTTTSTSRSSTSRSQTSTSNSTASAATHQRYDPLGINFDRPRYPTYAVLSNRSNTFGGWPAFLRTPKEMASAGFFYAGYGDYVRCFYCGGGLRNWEAGDDPWVEHARWFPRCAFVRMNKGEKFVNMVLKRQEELDSQRSQSGSTHQVDESSQGATAAPSKGDMDSSAVKAIREMGIQDELIKKALQIFHKKQKPGKPQELNATILMHIIIDEMDRAKEELPVSPGGAPGGELLPTTSEPEVTGAGATADPDMTPPSESLQSSDKKTSKTSSGQKSKNSKKKEKTDKPVLPVQPTTENEETALEQKDEDLETLQTENTELKDQLLCKICSEQNVSVAFLPCGHLVCCSDCAPAMRKCPICRDLIRGTVKTYFP